MKSLMLFAGLLALPFAPPAGWKPLPEAVVPPPLIHWEEGRSTFSVFGLGAGGDATTFDRIFAAQASASGSTIVTSSAQRICGRPGVRVVVHSDAAKTFTIEQAESIGGSLYVMSYARGDGDAVSVPISQFLSTSCNGAAITGAKPPLGWTVVGGRLIGVWVGRSPAYSISLISGPPRHYLEQFSNDAQQELALSGASAGNGSMETRTLCGFPATYATSHVASKNGQPLDITTEHTQSSSVAYTLIYTRPSNAGDDPKVDASLASLCAAVASAPPSHSPKPSPSPTSSPSPTVTPTPSPTPTETPTASPSPTITATPSPTPTETPSPSPTETPTPSPSPSPSPTETPTTSPSPTPTETPTSSPSGTETPTPSPEPLLSPEPTVTISPEPSPTVVASATPTQKIKKTI